MPGFSEEPASLNFNGGLLRTSTISFNELIEILLWSTRSYSKSTPIVSATRTTFQSRVRYSNMLQVYPVYADFWNDDGLAKTNHNYAYVSHCACYCVCNNDSTTLRSTYYILVQYVIMLYSLTCKERQHKSVRHQYTWLVNPVLVTDKQLGHLLWLLSGQLRCEVDACRMTSRYY